jgi:hypothetical protein
MQVYSLVVWRQASYSSVRSPGAYRLENSFHSTVAAIHVYREVYWQLVGQIRYSIVKK